MTVYCQDVSYLLENYETDAVIGEAEADIMNYKQPKNTVKIRYSETLREIVKMWTSIPYSRLKYLFIEKLHHSFRFSMRKYWNGNKDTTLQSSARFATSSFKQQEGFIITSVSSQTESPSPQRSTGSNDWEGRPTALMLIANKHSTNFSSSSEEAALKSFGSLKRRSRTSEKSMTPDKHVVFIDLKSTNHSDIPADILPSSAIARFLKMSVSRQRSVP